MLELAVLGFLHEAPMHGYELRKRLNDRLGAFRALSCGTLYPTLRRMQRAGLIEEEHGEQARNWGRRTRRVYRLTVTGKERFAELVGECGPQSCEDDSFGVHVAFFSRTPAETRMRILEGRRRRVEERREGLRSLLTRAGPHGDRYTLALHRLGFDHTEREVCWLNDLIEHERADQSGEHGRSEARDRRAPP